MSDYAQLLWANRYKDLHNRKLYAGVPLEHLWPGLPEQEALSRARALLARMGEPGAPYTNPVAAFDFGEEETFAPTPSQRLGAELADAGKRRKARLAEPAPAPVRLKNPLLALGALGLAAGAGYAMYPNAQDKYRDPFAYEEDPFNPRSSF